MNIHLALHSHIDVLWGGSDRPKWLAIARSMRTPALASALLSVWPTNCWGKAMRKWRWGALELQIAKHKQWVSGNLYIYLKVVLSHCKQTKGKTVWIYEYEMLSCTRLHQYCIDCSINWKQSDTNDAISKIYISESENDAKSKMAMQKKKHIMNVRQDVAMDWCVLDQIGGFSK